MNEGAYSFWQGSYSKALRNALDSVILHLIPLSTLRTTRSRRTSPIPKYVKAFRPQNLFSSHVMPATSYSSNQTTTESVWVLHVGRS